MSPNQGNGETGIWQYGTNAGIFYGAQASSNNEVWNKLPENKTLREEEYTLLKGKLAKKI